MDDFSTTYPQFLAWINGSSWNGQKFADTLQSIVPMSGNPQFLSLDVSGPDDIRACAWIFDKNVFVIANFKFHHREKESSTGDIRVVQLDNINEFQIKMETYATDSFGVTDVKLSVQNGDPIIMNKNQKFQQQQSAVDMFFTTLQQRIINK